MELARPSAVLRPGGASSRGRNGLIAALLGLLAIVLLAVALKSSNTKSGAPAAASALPRVVLADRAIPKGGSLEAAVAEGALHPSRMHADELREGAVTDVSALRGKVAAHDILRGQQIVAGDFKASDDAYNGHLSRYERAVAVPLDPAHGLVGDVKVGDHVDVLGAIELTYNGTKVPVVRRLARNVVVLRAAEKIEEGSTKAGVVTLKVSDTVAANIAFAVESGKVWLLRRPAAGARDGAGKSVTFQTVLKLPQPAGVPAPATREDKR